MDHVNPVIYYCDECLVGPFANMDLLCAHRDANHPEFWCYVCKRRGYIPFQSAAWTRTRTHLRKEHDIKGKILPSLYAECQIPPDQLLVNPMPIIQPAVVNSVPRIQLVNPINRVISNDVPLKDELPEDGEIETSDSESTDSVSTDDEVFGS